MENGPFEDIFPSKNGDIPASYVSLLECTYQWNIQALICVVLSTMTRELTSSLQSAIDFYEGKKPKAEAFIDVSTVHRFVFRLMF